MSKVSGVTRFDGWKNILTGLGFKGKDKRLESVSDYERLAEGEAENIYSSDEMAQKIVNTLPMDMLREGFRLSSPDLDDLVLEDSLDYFERLTMTEDGNQMVEGLIWGRLYGGAALVVGAEDGMDPVEPLDIDKIQKITHMTLLNRWELIPQGINGDPTSRNFGYPETYLIQPRVTDTTNKPGAQKFINGSVLIHHSRLIRFDGSRLPRRTFIRNHYWHDSILNKLADDIRDYQASFSSVSALILDFAQATYKIKNLADIVSSPDGMQIIQNRIAIIDQSRSILRATIVDADGEDFERKSTSMQGLDRVLGRLTQKFTAATEYPHTVLLGESPSGLGASGKSEKNDYFELVRREQNHTLKPKLMRIFRLIFAAGDGPTKGKIPDRFDIEFDSLRHLDQVETIEARKAQAETDKIYLEAGVVDADEIALSRFGSGEYDFETEINEDLRDTSERSVELAPVDEETDDLARMDARKNKKANRSRRFAGKKYR